MTHGQRRAIGWTCAFAFSAGAWAGIYTTAAYLLEGLTR